LLFTLSAFFTLHTTPYSALVVLLFPSLYFSSFTGQPPPFSPHADSTHKTTPAGAEGDRTVPRRSAPGPNNTTAVQELSLWSLTLDLGACLRKSSPLCSLPACPQQGGVNTLSVCAIG
jgi:hypothetical protein